VAEEKITGCEAVRDVGINWNIPKLARIEKARKRAYEKVLEKIKELEED